MATRSQIISDTGMTSSNYTNMNTYGSPGVFAAGLFTGGSGGLDNTSNYRYTGAGSFNGQDQYCKATGTSSFIDTSYFSGVTVRQSADVQAASASSRDCYYAIACADASSGNPHTIKLGKIINGTDTVIVSTTSNVTNAGFTIALEAVGVAGATDLFVYIDDVIVSALTQTAYSESGLASGQPGFICASTLTIDNFDAGDMVTAGGSSILALLLQRRFRQ